MASLIAFISYPPDNVGYNLYLQLQKALLEKVPGITLHPDPGVEQSTELLDEAVRGSDILLAVVTKGGDQSAQQRHVALAKRTGNTVILLRRPGAEVPSELPYDDLIDFHPVDAGLQKLQRKLDDLTAHRNAERAGRPATGAQPAADGGPVALGQDRTGRAGVRYIDEQDLPLMLGDRVRDRAVETEQLQRLLWDEAVRVVVLWGRPGIGKTAMVLRLLTSLAERSDAPVEWVGYLRGYGSRPLTAATLLEHLNKVLEGEGRGLGALLEDRTAPSVEKLGGLLRRLGRTGVLLVIDSLEGVIDPETEEIQELSLDELLRALAVGRWNHAVKLLLITRTRPEQLLRALGGTAKQLPLDNGLPWPEADDFLRGLDVGGGLGIVSASDTTRRRLYELTEGHPRALEAIYAILRRSDPPSLERLIEQMELHPSTETRREFLMGEVLDLLDSWERRVTQALAIYGRPVRPSAVDHLLRPHEGAEYESTMDLKRLVRLRLIRNEGHDYYLPSPDRERVLNRIPSGAPKDRASDPPLLNQLSLRHRAAAYFRDELAGPVESVADLGPQLTAIDLLLQGEEYEEAYAVIRAVDFDHLSHWGFGHLLAGRRGSLVGKLDQRKHELANLDALGNANKQHGDLAEALVNFSQALRLAQEVGDPSDMTRLHINLGHLYLEDGQLRWATTRYEMAVALAREHVLPTEEAFALHALSVSEGQRGRFLEALHHNNAVDQIVGGLRATADPRMARVLEPLEVQQLLALGYWHGQLGDPQRALAHLTHGQEVAKERGLRAAEVQFMSAGAEALLDAEKIEQATALAKDAAGLAEQIGNPQLMQPVWITLAQTQLAERDLVAAQRVATEASRLPLTARGLGAFILQGIVALLRRDEKGAYTAFRQAHEHANAALRRDDPSFALLDLDGLALYGLALLSKADHLDDAVASFRKARAITDHRGVVSRVLRLLDELGSIAPPGQLEVVRDAASGRG